ncbi:Uma2 family endonuclease [Gloeocapsa sp. PCC 73106]|uniref:Uma2 family endonuclease n=1 Tax=Gloeocapsa sp. PCC 73106 TaxID=102232 RepID=UPI0002ABD0A3|nr:Uma2 family endonuclease [Gloeocapsa sp. PCC 73106]ELR97826.1 hypothetical protein GLO73106DRAFT_00016430 [Gloeocapsa sp. PCC 73106]
MTITTQPKIVYPTGPFWSDEPPLESNLHLQQILLLIQSLKWLWRERQDYFVSGNLTIYYSPHQKKSEDFRGPDFFVVTGTTLDWTRGSWVVWKEEGKYPNLIIEILSKTTAKIDKGEKKQIYQDIFRTPEYFWFDPESLELKGFALISGKYQEITTTAAGQLQSKQLDLYLGIVDRQLRYFSPSGELIPTSEEEAIRERERAQQAEERAQQAEERAQQEREKSERLAARLRALGIDPEA